MIAGLTWLKNNVNKINSQISSNLKDAYFMCLYTTAVIDVKSPDAAVNWCEVAAENAADVIKISFCHLALHSRAASSLHGGIGRMRHSLGAANMAKLLAMSRQ